MSVKPRLPFCFDEKVIYNRFCHAIFRVYNYSNASQEAKNFYCLPKENFFIEVETSVIDDYLLDELMIYNRDNDFVRNIFQFRKPFAVELIVKPLNIEFLYGPEYGYIKNVLSDGYSVDESTMIFDTNTTVIRFEVSDEKWNKFASSLISLYLKFTIADNQFRAKHLIACKKLRTLHIYSTLNYSLFHGDTEEIINECTPALNELIINGFGFLVYDDNCKRWFKILEDNGCTIHSITTLLDRRSTDCNYANN